MSTPNKKNKLTLLQKLQLKIVALVSGSVLGLLLIIGVTTCILVGVSDNHRVNKELQQANYDAYEQSLSKTFENKLNNIYNWLGPDDSFPEPPKDNGHIKPPDSDSKQDRSKQYLGGRELEKESPIPIVTYIIKDGKLVETDYGIMSAYLAENVLNEATDTVSKSQDGMRNILNLGLTYRKDTIDKTSYVAFTSIEQVSNWQNVGYTLLLSTIVILIVVSVIAWVFAKRFTSTLKKTWDNQERFIADASHDLKTPLTVILTSIGIMKRNQESSVKQMSEWIENIEDEATKMQELTNSMLDMAKIEAAYKQDMHKYFENTDVSKIAKKICFQMDSIAFESGIKFKHNIDNNIFVNGIPDNIERIFTTLTENAFKHAIKDDSVKVELFTIEKQAIFKVNNMLSYIDSEEMKHIFERFHHSPNGPGDKVGPNNNTDQQTQSKSSNNKFTSHGLGLSIAKTLVEQHDGTISAESSHEKGTTFTVKLPLSK